MTRTGDASTAPEGTAGGGSAPAGAYLALGDSYTIGEGVAEDGRWAVRLARALRAEGLAIADPRIIARTGWTTDELDAAIDAAVAAESNAECGTNAGSAMGSRAGAPGPEAGPAGPAGVSGRLVPGGFAFASLLIGVNNQYRGRSLDEYGEQFAGLLERALDFVGGRPERVLALSIPDWGVTPFAREQGRNPAEISAEIDAFNRRAAEICGGHGVAFVDITPVSRDRGGEAAMLAEDGLHPSAAMYARWVETALPAARARWRAR